MLRRIFARRGNSRKFVLRASRPARTPPRKIVPRNDRSYAVTPGSPVPLLWPCLPCVPGVPSTNFENARWPGGKHTAHGHFGAWWHAVTPLASPSVSEHWDCAAQALCMVVPGPLLRTTPLRMIPRPIRLPNPPHRNPREMLREETALPALLLLPHPDQCPAPRSLNQVPRFRISTIRWWLPN